MILEEREYKKEKYERKTMNELRLKMKLFPCLVNLLLGDQIILFDFTNDTTSSLNVALSTGIFGLAV